MYGGLAAKSCQSLTTPWTVALCNQSPLSMGFPRQEYWSELPFPSPGDLLDPGIEPASPALEGAFFTTIALSHFTEDSDISLCLNFLIVYKLLLLRCNM